MKPRVSLVCTLPAGVRAGGIDWPVAVAGLSVSSVRVLWC